MSMRVYRFVCGTVAIEEMREESGISITECVGSLPDEFCTSYRPVVHPSLPDSDGTDIDFRKFLDVLRTVSEKDASLIVASAVR